MDTQTTAERQTTAGKTDNQSKWPDRKTIRTMSRQTSGGAELVGRIQKKTDKQITTA